MADEIERATGIKSIRGMLNEREKLGLKNDHLIDSLAPDYSILDDIEYKYPVGNAYFTYMTRGCIRKCPFCAVHELEPHYVDYIPLKEQIDVINERYGPKKDLLLLDNNVLASSKFDSIIDEIKGTGFYKGALLNGKRRYVDFNQGVDARRMTKAKMKRLAELPIKPLRIAFDHINLK
ncbi:MAG: cobalamin-binding domain-containing protein, partial [Candidatus Thorarchaeota archaeon]